MKDLSRFFLKEQFPRARVHRLENGQAQIINPTGRGLFEALGSPQGNGDIPSRDARKAWRAAFLQQNPTRGNSHE